MNYDFNYFKNLEPMKYYDKGSDGLSDSLLAKRNAMIENKNDGFIATRKWDGEWAMFIKWEGQILIRSRSLSKVTGEYGDKTQHLPHLVEEMQYWPDNTVILGEVCWPTAGKVSTDVGTILRCLPAKAIARQEIDKLYVKCFDCLALNGQVFMNIPYEKRLVYLLMLIPVYENGKYFDVTDICPPTKTPAQFADEIISIGGEGAVIQRRDCLYEPGKRSAWHTLKLKQRLPEAEYKVIATIPANKEYNGKYPETWQYFCYIDDDGSEKNVPLDYASPALVPAEELEHPSITGSYLDHPCYPVTKPYYLGWMMGVRFDVNGTLCDASSGLTDEDRAWLATDEAQNLIAEGLLYVTIKGMMVATLGGIRHPVIVKLREMDEAMLSENI